MGPRASTVAASDAAHTSAAVNGDLDLYMSEAWRSSPQRAMTHGRRRTRSLVTGKAIFRLLRHGCGCPEGNVSGVAPNGSGILAGWVRAKSRTRFWMPTEGCSPRMTSFPNGLNERTANLALGHTPFRAPQPFSDPPWWRAR